MNIFQHLEEIDSKIQAKKEENKIKNFEYNIEVGINNTSNPIGGTGMGFTHIQPNGIGGWTTFDTNGTMVNYIPDGTGGFFGY